MKNRLVRELKLQNKHGVYTKSALPISNSDNNKKHLTGFDHKSDFIAFC